MRDDATMSRSVSVTVSEGATKSWPEGVVLSESLKEF
jgi:hypothetical protein